MSCEVELLSSIAVLSDRPLAIWREVLSSAQHRGRGSCIDKASFRLVVVKILEAPLYHTHEDYTLATSAATVDVVEVVSVYCTDRQYCADEAVALS